MLTWKNLFESSQAFLKNKKFQTLKKMCDKDIFNCRRFFLYTLWYKKEEKRIRKACLQKNFHQFSSSQKYKVFMNFLI